MTSSSSIAQQLSGVFSAAGAKGYLHAANIDGEGEVELNADDLVVTASVFKIAVALELARRFASGDVDPKERLIVRSEDRVMGPTGLSVMVDDAELSLRDLAFLMIHVSDNTATDLVMSRIGIDSINQTLRSLGLEKTHIVGDCRALLSDLLEDLGVRTPEQAQGLTWESFTPDQLNACRSLSAEVTTRSTPRETSRLVQMIWRDEAGSPEACAEVRRLLGLQVWPHRLSSGFGDEAIIAAKTGTLPRIRNEAGIVTIKGDGRYSVAVFTVAEGLSMRLPEVDRSIGRAARIAVDALRDPQSDAARSTEGTS